jgi:uncharacterized protein YozE (UPF0346 family)
VTEIDPTRYRKPRPPLGRWLLSQQSRTDPIGTLAKAAAADRAFPKDGDFAAISAHLNRAQADGDVHAALEDAEIDWAAY